MSKLKFQATVNVKDCWSGDVTQDLSLLYVLAPAFLMMIIYVLLPTQAECCQYKNVINVLTSPRLLYISSTAGAVSITKISLKVPEIKFKYLFSET